MFKDSHTKFYYNFQNNVSVYLQVYFCPNIPYLKYAYPVHVCVCFSYSMTVSYTHLDVYKRQGIWHSGHMSTPSPLILLNRLV